MQTEVRIFQGREATVLLRADGIAVRKLKQRSARLRMRDSAKLLCVSRHPNLVRIFKVQDSEIYMQGMTVSLQELAPAAHTLPFHAKLCVALAVARGICHLHLHGMDHGDLCPSNILLSDEAQVKLCDFYNENTGTRRTAAYSSPEVVRAPQHTMCAADVWALACCLLFLEGVEPFCGFEEDQTKLFYLGLHQCVAFREGGVCKPFTLHDCAYAPARHAASSAWSDILAAAFVPEPSRLTSHEICEKLDTLQAPPVPMQKTQTARVPFQRLNV